LIKSMEFVKVLKISRYLDPSHNFTETEWHSEIRYDPLTGHSTRILDFPIREVKKADISAVVESSQKFCPFCPEVIELVTPKFHPDLVDQERYAKGEALCVPNAFPYDENGAVTVMTRSHYLGLSEFTPENISNALSCCVSYLQDVYRRQKDMIYQSVNWNYMPLAGGSIIHPHLQIMASSSPTNYYVDLLSSLDRYRQATERDFWPDLVQEEHRLAERLISRTEEMTWLVAFAPMGIFDVIGVLNHVRYPWELAGQTLDQLAEGIVSVMRYIDSLNMSSLNMSLYFLLDNGLFTPHVRICPRVSIPPYDTSQINYMWMLHRETLTIVKPEEACVSIRSVWENTHMTGDPSSTP